MAKSTITLPDGTTIIIDGTLEEIKKIISLYSFQKKEILNETKKDKGKKKNAVESTEDILLKITNHIKECDEAEAIAKNILDRPGQVDRVLLPLYIADKLDQKILLTSGDIYEVLKELGIKMVIPNISKTLRNSASKYVMADKRVKRGQAGGYRITRPGIQYLSKVLMESKND